MCIRDSAMGGTPCNATLPLVREGQVAVVTGVNLPMLLSALTNRTRMNVESLAGKVMQDARKTIIVVKGPSREPASS